MQLAARSNDPDQVPEQCPVYADCLLILRTRREDGCDTPTSTRATLMHRANTHTRKSLEIRTDRTTRKMERQKKNPSLHIVMGWKLETRHVPACCMASITHHKPLAPQRTPVAWMEGTVRLPVSTRARAAPMTGRRVQGTPGHPPVPSDPDGRVWHQAPGSARDLAPASHATHKN